MTIRSGSPNVATILRKHGVADVLVVDDEEMLREGIIDFIQDSGYSAMGAGNGLEALDYLASVPLRPKLILLDLRMPIMDGWELLNRLRDSVAFSTIPLVIVSAHRNQMAARDEPAFPVRFMDKPIDLRAFIELLRETCGPSASTPPAASLTPKLA